jgi:2-dehydropantoate 2-reductase
VQSDPVAIGPAPGSPKPLLSPIEVAHMLSKAKVPTIAVPDVLPVIWAKAIYTCALNGLCSIHEMPYGGVLQKDDTREAMRRVVRECYAVGEAKKVRLEPSTSDAYLTLLEGRLIPQTAAHYPSMLQDLKKGKRTDIDALNGAISRMGRETGVSTPENDRIAEAIRKREPQDLQQV